MGRMRIDNTPFAVHGKRCLVMVAKIILELFAIHKNVVNKILLDKKCK
jgi:hypothetical protein